MSTPAGMASPESNSDFERSKFAREAILSELTYRRDKQWRIFSWVATLLLAAIAGVVVLTGDNRFAFAWPQRVLMAGALAIIAAYTSAWIAENIGIEAAAQRALTDYDQRLGIAHVVPDPQRGPSFGYVTTVRLLALAAALAVLFAPTGR